MNVRKIGLIVACLLSGVSAFLPFYFIQYNGETIEDGALSIMPSYYAIGIVVTAVLTIGFAVSGIRTGYIITSLINVGASFYSCYKAFLAKDLAMYTLKMTEQISQAVYSGQTQSESVLSGIDVVTGPGFVLLILAAVLVLLMMFWNVVNPNDD